MEHFHCIYELPSFLVGCLLNFDAAFLADAVAELLTDVVMVLIVMNELTSNSLVSFITSHAISCPANALSARVESDVRPAHLP